MTSIILGKAETAYNEGIVIEFQEHESARYLVLRPIRRSRTDRSPVVWQCQGTIKIGLGRAQGVVDALEGALQEARKRGYFADFEPKRVVVFPSKSTDVRT